MCFKEMNATSIVTRSTRCGTSAVGQRAGVDAFAHDDARVVAQPPIELSVADVERDDARRAALQQDVGEAAGRGADVECQPAGDDDPEHVERVGELDAAAPHVRVIGRHQLDARVRRDRGARLRRDLSVHGHPVREDHRASPLTRRRQPAIDDQHIETHFRFHLPDKGPITLLFRRSSIRIVSHETQLVRVLTQSAIGESQPAERPA